MGMRGLPALKRAVPVRFLRVGKSRTAGKWGDGGARLLELVAALPADLREKALTHSSRAAARIDSNERLEFLGDSVLGLAIATELFRRHPESEEGELARMKAFVVSRANCSELAEKLNIGELMEAETQSSVAGRGRLTHSRTIQGNALEALIGAVYLAFGLEASQGAVVGAFGEVLERGVSETVDSKTSLQEWLAQLGLQPRYELSSERGPAHARVFSSEVSVDGVLRGRGSGTTIKMSEQAAAKEALTSYGVDVGAD